ncbi:hypothetical protein ACNQFZ_09790 [Schinkia sp. CFF1]
MSKILNQKGSSSILLLSSLFLLVILFFVIYTAGEVLLFKQRTSIAAEQASLVVTSVVLEQAKSAVDAHDALDDEDRTYSKIWPRINDHGPFVTNDDFKNAFDRVVEGDLNSGNDVLRDLLESKIDLNEAVTEAEKSVEENQGNSLEVQINSGGRFQSKVENRYWLSIFNWIFGKKEEELSGEEKKSKSITLSQKGLGPKLAFMKALGY